MQKSLHRAVTAGRVAGKGSILCVLEIENDVICYFCDCLQTADVKQAAIELALCANVICSRDVVRKDESHCHKEEVENSRC